jgi:hypothetical protein
MAGAHDEAPDGVENCRERAERFNISVAAYSSLNTGDRGRLLLDGE